MLNEESEYKGSILVIDDEESIINAIRRQMRKSIHTLYFATSPADAFVLLNEHAIDLIITDIRMQSMEGVEFLEQLEKDYPDILRIVLTGYTELNSVLNAVNKGKVYQYLTKPWEPTDLTTAITHAMRERDNSVQRKLLMEKIYSQNNDLEILNKELVGKNKKIAKISHERYEFFTKVNQEIHTILHGVNNMIDILMGTALSEVQNEYLSAIEDGNMGVVSILNDVMDLISLEKNNIVLNNVDFRFDRVVEQVMASVKDAALEKTIDLDQAVDSRACRWFFSDPSRIKQIMKHLLLNAINHTNDGSVFLDINVVEQDDNMAQIKITVTDTGCGMSPEQIIQLMSETNENLQVSNTDQRATRGIGLKICSSLLKSMSSKLMCESKEGVGSTFYFTMPMDFGSPSFENFTVDYNINQLDVVCIGDSKAFFVIFDGLLSGVGHSKNFFKSNEMQPILEEVHKCHCVIISNAITQADPFTLIEEIRRVNPSVKIIMYAGKTHRGHASIAQKNSVDGYLTKPFDKNLLNKLIMIVMSLEGGKAHPLITRYITHHIHLKEMHNTQDCEDKING